jgi:tRNA dimethylallyltransferase
MKAAEPTQPLLVIVGPTASGKTSLAVRLAEQCGGEIISADSVQVYRHVTIGSGKPSPEELARAKHHLIDVVDPDEAMDAAVWADRARRCVNQVRAGGGVPIICGGTFLYVRALLYGLAPAPPADEGIRHAHRALADKEGRAALHRLLAHRDPACAERLAPNDLVRVSRALEVLELSGITMTAWQAQHGFKSPTMTFRLVGVAQDREQLAQRIESRVVAMLAAGWEQEVQSLLDRGWGETRPLGAVGYRQVKDFLSAGAQGSREALCQDIARATRIFARRQRTWLRDEPVRWLSPSEVATATVPDLLA